MWRESVCQCFYPKSLGQNADTFEKISEYPDVKKFYRSVQNQTNDTVSAFRNQAKDNRRISVKTLKEAITGLLETESKIVQIISQQKKEVWNDQFLSDVVRAFFSTVEATLKFCDEIQLSILRARENHSFVRKAVNSVRPGELPAECEESGIFRELNNFRKAKTPFTKDFRKSFRAVQIQHENLLRVFNEMKAKLISEEGGAKFWRKVSAVIFVAAMAGLVICAVVTAAIGASPAVVGALSAATSFPADGISSWVQSLYRFCEVKMKALPPVDTYLPIEELNNIESLVDNILNQAGGNVICFWLRDFDPKALQLAVDNLKRTSNQFMDDLEALEKHVSKVRKRTEVAQEKVSKKLSKHLRRK